MVRVSNFEENLPKSLPARDFVEQTAAEKLHAVIQEMKTNNEIFDVVLASDTVIYFEGEIIGKPTDAKDAFRTLQRLRGHEHFVYTGVALAYNDGTEEVFSEETRVEFGDYPDRIIKQYVDSGEPLTRAGSYGIQEYGAVFVKAVHGCFSNVVGLPIYRVHSALVAKGIL
ncbi:septum formation protein Maf [Cooperia oncophora]